MRVKTRQWLGGQKKKRDAESICGWGRSPGEENESQSISWIYDTHYKFEDS